MTKGNTAFLTEKNTALKGTWIHYEHLEISHHLMDRPKKQSAHQFHKIFFHMSKYLAFYACRKNITVEDNKKKKKRMNAANFINIYTNIYTCIICYENDSK